MLTSRKLDKFIHILKYINVIIIAVIFTVNRLIDKQIAMDIALTTILFNVFMLVFSTLLKLVRKDDDIT